MVFNARVDERKKLTGVIPTASFNVVEKNQIEKPISLKFLFVRYVSTMDIFRRLAIHYIWNEFATADRSLIEIHIAIASQVAENIK